MSFLAQYDAIPPAYASERVGLAAKWIRSAPRAFFAELRERRPVFRTPAFTLVTRYRDVLEVLQRPTQFSVRIYGSKMDEVVGPSMLGRDNATENYRDKSVMRVATPLSDLPRVRAVVAELTDQQMPCGAERFDIVKALTRHVPVKLCGAYFGFPGPDIDTMIRWSKATQTDFFKNIGNDPAIHAAAVAAGSEMKAYLADLLTSPIDGTRGCTVVSRLRQLAAAQLLPLDQSELISNVAGLLIGTVETTSQAVAQAVQQILLRPKLREDAIREAAASDPARFDQMVWEALRFDPINPLLPRFTESDTIIGANTEYETVLARGTIVFACTASAMWDEAAVENADEFRLDRPDFTYLHFGVGSHDCLGRHVGAVMVPEMVRRIMLRKPRLVEGDAGKIDFLGGPFPESFQIDLTA